MSHHELDLDFNRSSNPEMRAIIARRNVLKGGAGLAALSFLGGLAGCNGDGVGDPTPYLAPPVAGGVAPQRATTLSFNPVA